MGLFRPAKTVTGPSGDYWELYVSKTALPAWRGSDADDSSFLGASTTLPEFIVEFPLLVLTFLWANILLPLGRAVVFLPAAVVRGRRSRAVRIEAVKNFPQREVFLWTTTDVHKPRVLDEIAAGLARGKVVQPDGAVYSGRE